MGERERDEEDIFDCASGILEKGKEMMERRRCA
jgi:hypothetical protein